MVRNLPRPKRPEHRSTRQEQFWSLVDMICDTGYVIVALMVLTGTAAGVDVAFHYAIVLFHTANAVSA